MAAASRLDAEPAIAAAAPGRVEGCNDAREIGAGMSGVLASVNVDEGGLVRAGDVIATLDCQDVIARLSAAEASAEARTQALLRVERGARSEERAAAAAAEDEARAAWQQATEHADRQRRLFEDDQVVSRESADSARRAAEAARARLAAATARHQLLQAGPLPEEAALVRAEADAAARRVVESKAEAEKCTVRAPMNARVVRVFRRAGEAVSNLYPAPVCLLADDGCLRIRAELDEADLGRIRTGQEVIVQAEALPEAGIRGRVVESMPLMGRRRVRSGDPAEKADRDVREVLIALDDPGVALPLGLRVTALFLAAR